MSFNEVFNRQYEMIEFPYFVPKEELEYNFDYARMMVEENWISENWNKMFGGENMSSDLDIHILYHNLNYFTATGYQYLQLEIIIFKEVEHYHGNHIKINQ
jgi:hypothetical protein